MKLKYPDKNPSNLQLPDKLAVRRKAGNKALVDNFIPRYRLDQTGIHVIAQIVAHLSTLRLNNVSGETVEGEFLAEVLGESSIGFNSTEFQTDCAISGLAFVKNHFKTPEMMGLYRFLMLDTRSSYLKKQYTGDARNYCALVPLVLSAFKRYHNIPYSAWARDEIRWVVNPDLCEAMLYEIPEDTEDFSFSDTEKLLELREHGLTWKSGKNIGEAKNPLYTHSLSGMHKTEFKDVPDLAQVMLTQIWCAHPENRTKYMVLNCENWDCIPLCLINNNVFVELAKPVDYSGLTPWEM
jgi:hypothetical protein